MSASNVIVQQKRRLLRYGEGSDDLDDLKCDDCGVLRGQMHKMGCDLEPCPRCGSQAISCDCFYDDD